MYEWLIFLHVVGALGFLMVYGATISVLFRLKVERETARIEALLSLREMANRWMSLPLLVLVGSGVIMGFTGNWWGRGWIWVSLGILVGAGIALSLLSRPYTRRIWDAIDPVGHPLRQGMGNHPPAAPDELEAILNSSRPRLLTAIGAIGLAVILWLMMYKPF